jgi:hypothetical protein
MMEMSLPKKLAKHAVRIELFFFFPYDAFGIGRMIWDKMASSDFIVAW